MASLHNINPNHEIAVQVFSSRDSKGAYFGNFKTNLVILQNKLANGFEDTRQIVAQSLPDLTAQLKKIPNPIQLLILYGHGSKNKMSIGKSHLTIDNLEQHREIFDKVDANGTIILVACSKGKNLLAQKIHQLFKRTVFASTSNCSTGSLYLIRRPDNRFMMHFYDFRRGKFSTICYENEAEILYNKTTKIWRAINDQYCQPEEIPIDLCLHTAHKIAISKSQLQIWRYLKEAQDQSKCDAEIVAAIECVKKKIKSITQPGLREKMEDLYTELEKRSDPKTNQWLINEYQKGNLFLGQNSEIAERLRKKFPPTSPTS